MDQNMRFEEALRRLDDTVRALESGSLDLDASLGRFEEGVRLVAHCRQLLDGAQRRVALLTGVDDQGQPTTVPLPSPSNASEPATEC